MTAMEGGQGREKEREAGCRGLPEGERGREAAARRCLAKPRAARPTFLTGQHKEEMRVAGVCRRVGDSGELEGGAIPPPKYH